MTESVWKEISEKVETEGPHYMANVVLTLKTYALERQHLKPGDVLPLFYKKFDELGVLAEFAINGSNPQSNQISTGFEVTLQEIEALLDKVESDEDDFMTKFEVVLLMGRLEQMISDRTAGSDWVDRRYIERIYEDPNSDIPTAYRLHFSVDEDYLRSMFPDLEEWDLISRANN